MSTFKDYTEYKWQIPKTCSHDYIVPVLISIIKKLNLPSHINILDAGCGGGSLAYTLHNNLGFKNIYGFDISKSGIELAKKSFPELAKGFFIHNGYESKLPLDVPQKYDLVIAMEIIEHLCSPEIYLENVCSWLNRDGYFIITTPYHGYLKNLLISLTNQFDRHFDPLQEGGHIKFFSKKTVSSILDKRGFKVLKFEGAGRIPYIWKSMILVTKRTE